MIESIIEFPKELERKFVSKVNNKVKITFCGGAYITNEIFNLTILEPYKIIFSYKKKTIIAFVVERIDNNKKIYDFFVGSIEKQNKQTMTNLIAFINNLISK